MVCDVCNCPTGGNGIPCVCSRSKSKSVSKKRGDSARALIDALIDPKVDFISAWDDACLHWNRFGEAPSRIGILEAALLEAIDIARSQGPPGEEDIERLNQLELLALTKK